MIQAGDTVRYLNAVGGGKVVRVEGRIAYVDDDGFETPVMVNELVVVLPAGHEPSTPGKKYFDQSAYDMGRSDSRPAPKQAPAPKPAPVEEDFPIEETEYGDDITVVLAFEPADVKQLSTTMINVVLVNDSNYFLSYMLLRRNGDNPGWIEAARGEAAPNELVDLTECSQATVRDLERVVFQAIAYKKDKPFDVKSPLNVSRKLDLTKFFKVHCFHPGIYFDTPVIEVPLYADTVRPKDRKPTSNRKR